MDLEKLRKKHPRFIYQSFDFRIKNQQLEIRFHFLLEPKIKFTPTLTLSLNQELKQSLKPKQLASFVFHLGLMETISYWKAACSPELIIKAGQLTKEQIRWWHNLFLYGLGEFFYQNQIDFRQKNFFTIVSQGPKHPPFLASTKSLAGDLILVGGGRDSAVTLELLKKLRRVRRGTLVVQSTTAIHHSLKIISIANYPPPIVIRRTIDPNLLILNQKGYLNGHTPFSALLAFLGVFVAVLYRFRRVIVANERSASSYNLIYRGLKINHQYSKSLAFERLFRQYLQRHLNPVIEYFSFLRPLYELQISQLFASFPQYHRHFLSCNLGQKQGFWCLRCPKCAFVFLSLAPFLSASKITRIFGTDLWQQPAIINQLEQLTGLKGNKPFDCVGTQTEALLALGLTLERFRKEKLPLPPRLTLLVQKLKLNQEKIKILKKKILQGWLEKHFLPQSYAQLLKQAIKNNATK